MEKSSLGKGVLFCVVFLGVFALMIGYMPPQMFYNDTIPEYSERVTPSEYWTSEDIKTLLYGDEDYSNVSTAFYLDIERGTLETVNIEGYWQRLSGDYDQWVIRRYWYQWGFWKQVQDILPVIPRNTRSEPKWLSQEDIYHEDNLDDSANFSRIDMKDNSFNYVLFMSYNYTEYDSLQEAVDDGHVLIEMAMGWEYESGALSGWDIIARLLFFQPIPEIGDALLTAIIALPIWTSIGFLVFVTITMIVEMLPFT